MSSFGIILAITLFCLGLREVTDDVNNGRIGYPVRKWFIDQEWIPLWIAEPIILCCTCMASFWGSIVYWSIVNHYSSDLSYLLDFSVYVQWVFCCVSAAFTNTLFWILRNKMMGLLG